VLRLKKYFIFCQKTTVVLATFYVAAQRLCKYWCQFGISWGVCFAAGAVVTDSD